MGDGPDWRQVDRARLLQARKEEREKVLLEWAGWCEEPRESGMAYPELQAKAKELRARLLPPLPDLIPHPFPLPLAKTNPSK
jgi:hypothetical protein